MTLENINDLSDDNEYVVIWTGQSTSRPFGKQEEAFELFPDFDFREQCGLDVKVTITAGNAHGSGASIQMVRSDLTSLLNEGQWVGAQLRLIDSNGNLVPGAGTIQSNGPVLQGTIDWEVNIPGTTTNVAAPINPDDLADWATLVMTPDHTGITVDVGGDRLDIGVAPPVAGTAFRLTGTAAPGGLSLNTTYYLGNASGNTFQVYTNRELTGGIITITSAGTAVDLTFEAYTEVDGWVVFEDMRFAKSPNVRVLTPYQPTTEDVEERIIDYPASAGQISEGARALTIPGLANGASSHETSAAFLDFTFNEGIASPGYSDVYGDGSGSAAVNRPVTGVSGLVVNAGSALKVNALVGGTLRIEWDDGDSTIPGSGTPRVGVGFIVANTVSTITVASWFGDAPSTAASNSTEANWRWSAWVPHYDNSPHASLPGLGYTYPSNDMQPHSDTTAFVNGAVIRDVPRNGNGNPKNYKDLFGAMIVAATRLSQSIGKRVNVVHLGVNGSVLAPTSYRNPRGFPGRVGWYDQNKHLSWTPSTSEGIFERLRTLVGTCIQNALDAEGNTKTPYVLAMFHSQGEGDALQASARLNYNKSLPQFVEAERNLIDDTVNNGKSLNPYVGTRAKVPFIQPEIFILPYCLKGSFVYYNRSVNFSGDVNLLINKAIREHAEHDEFSRWYFRDDLPRNLESIDNGVANEDPGHANGVGECIEGTRIGHLWSEVIDYALGFGSPALRSQQWSMVDLCNAALNAIGHRNTIVTLSEDSTEAEACRLLLDDARDTLLGARQWGFALRRRALAEVIHPEQQVYSQWKYCYAVPDEALNGFQVIEPDTVEADYDFNIPAALGYSDEVVANFEETFALTPFLDSRYVPQAQLPLRPADSFKPMPFQVERSRSGGRLLYTNVQQATLQFVERVSDPKHWPPAFRQSFVHHLGARLAGSIIGGREGERVAQQQLIVADNYAGIASSKDAQMRRPEDGPFDFTPGHIRYRT